MPLYGGSYYFPPDNHYGRAGVLPNVIAGVGRLWREDRERVEGEAARVMEALAEAGPGPESAQFIADEAPSLARIREFFLAALMRWLGGAQNFPGPP